MSVLDAGRFPLDPERHERIGHGPIPPRPGEGMSVLDAGRFPLDPEEA